MNRVRDMRGGKDYDADFASRMRGTGIWADLLRQRFYKAADRLGYRYNRYELDTSRFRPPALPAPPAPRQDRFSECARRSGRVPASGFPGCRGAVSALL